MTPEFMLTTFILFIAGVVAVPIASALGLGSVLGYLIAGIVISPLLHALGVDTVALQHFAEFGVVMMLFIVGLEMNPKSLWDMRGKIFVLGGLQVTATTLLVAGVAIAFGQPATVAIAIGLIFALSSTAIVNQTLKEKGLFHSDGGQSSFSVLLFQDIAVIPILALVPLLAMPELLEQLAHAADAGHGDGHGGGHEEGLNINLVEGLNGWQTALVTLAAIGGVVAAGAYLTTPIFRFVARAQLRELFVTTALMIVLGIALLMTTVGLSPALGTFLAGVVMAGSEYRHELESDIDPFKGIFLGVFFITVGASIDFELLGSQLGLILGLTVGLICLKSVVLLVLARVFRLEGGDKWLFGLGLAQAGEFGFVLLSFTVANGVIPSDVKDILLLVVALSMLLTPALFILYDKVIAPRYSRQQDVDAEDIESGAKIIIAGHGRFGGIVNRALRGAGYDTTVLDYSAEQLAMMRKFEMRSFYGDATRPDLLEAAGIAEAKILVVAIDDKAGTTHIVDHVTRHYPEVHIVARARDRNHVYDLYAAGCRDIIREVYDSSTRAARSVFEALGDSRDVAEERIAAFNQVDRRAIRDLAEVYDPNIPSPENEAFMERYHEMRSEWDAELTGAMRRATNGDATE